MIVVPAVRPRVARVVHNRTSVRRVAIVSIIRDQIGRVAPNRAVAKTVVVITDVVMTDTWIIVTTVVDRPHRRTVVIAGTARGLLNVIDTTIITVVRDTTSVARSVDRDRSARLASSLHG